MTKGPREKSLTTMAADGDDTVRETVEKERRCAIFLYFLANNLRIR